MLELIFQGFMEWLYGLILECWQYFSSALLNIMSMDFAYLRARIPILGTVEQTLLAVGWALLMGNLVFQAVKSMAAGLGFDGEDPKLLFTRTFIFAFLLLASPQICELGLNFTQNIIDILRIPRILVIGFANEDAFGGLGAAWLLVIVCGILIMVKVLKLIVEIAERYIILAFLTLCAPLAFGMGGSRSTSDIFTGWCRMFGSMCLVMVTNVIFFKMLLSVLTFVPSGLGVLPWMVLALGIVKVAKKVDMIITRIGLNPALTGGDHGGHSLAYLVMRTMTTQAVKAAGRAAGGTGRGKTPHQPSGGNHPPGTPPSGSGGPHSAAGAAAWSAGTAAAQRSAALVSDNPAQPGASPAGAVQMGGQYSTDARQQVGGASTSIGSVDSKPQSAGYSQNRSSRKTSVTPGSRRGASHLPPAGLPGTAGTAPPKPSGTGQSTGNQTASQTKSGMAGTNRIASAAGMRSGTAGKTPAQSNRFTAVTSQQVGKGGADSPATSAGQNHRFTEQGGQTRGGAGEHRQPAPPSDQGAAVKQGPDAMRFTRHPADPVNTAAGSSPAVRTPRGVERPAQAAVPASPVKPALPGTQAMSGISRAGPVGVNSDQSRQSRNASHSGSGGRSNGSMPSTARQEQAAASTHPASKAAGQAMRPGTAGMGAKGKQAVRASQTTRKQAPASKPMPIATGMSGGRRPPSDPPAPQGRRSGDRESGRRPGNGGIVNGT